MEKMEKVENTNSFMAEDFAKQKEEIDILNMIKKGFNEKLVSVIG